MINRFDNDHIINVINNRVKATFIQFDVSLKLIGDVVCLFD